jgi:chemotaxis protein MotA
MLYLDPPSFMIVIIGSFLAMVAASPLQRSIGMWRYIRLVLNVQSYNKDAIISQLVQFADSARKEGLLSLDDALNDVADDFLRSGLRLVVDGTDPDVIKRILYTNITQIENRHQDGIEFFNTWSKISPALGMIGTLLGLIGMLANLEDTASVGPNMAVALVTTLYGSMFANLVLIPIKTKLEDRDKQEMLVKEIMVQGILSIQAGDNPRILEDKLYTFLPPKERPVKAEGEI